MIIATLFFPMHVALFVLIASTKPGFFYCSNVDAMSTNKATCMGKNNVAIIILTYPHNVIFIDNVLPGTCLV